MIKTQTFNIVFLKTTKTLLKHLYHYADDIYLISNTGMQTCINNIFFKIAPKLANRHCQITTEVRGNQNSLMYRHIEVTLEGLPFETLH